MAANLAHDVNGISPILRNLFVKLLNCRNNKGFSLYIVEPFDDEALALAIYRYFDGNKKEEYIRGITEREYRFSWDRMAEALA